MVNLVGAIPRVQELFELPVIVGGLAVMSRLGNAYRVTQDLDALRRRLEGAASSLEVSRAAGAKDINEIGGLVPTERGDVRVDVLEARHKDLDRDFTDPTDPTDRLEAMAHQWTLDTATPMDIVATSVDTSSLRGDAGPTIDRTQAVALPAVGCCEDDLLGLRLVDPRSSEVVPTSCAPLGRSGHLTLSG